MKITKYPQSCLKIESDGRALLVDYGVLTSAEYSVSQLGQFDAVLFTHSHHDHFDPAKLGELIATGATLYGNANVAQLAGTHSVEVIEDNEELVVAGFKLETFHMEHCLMTDGSSATVPNTAFLVNDRLLLPGDSTADVGIKAEIVAVPVFGPDISPKDAYDLMKSTGAKMALPVHYDVSGMNPGTFKRMAGISGEAHFEVTALANGESAEF